MVDMAGRAPVALAAGRGELRLAGLALITLGAWFLTTIMLGASMAPGYDVSGGAISDLGVIAQTRLLFNASLVLVGTLNVAAGVLLYRSFGSGATLAVFCLAGAGAIGAGLFPLDSGGLHGLFALLAFVAFNAEACAVGLAVAGPMRPMSLAAGLVGLAFVVLMVVGDAADPAVFGPIGHGGAERMIVYPAMLWALVFGGSLVGLRASDGSAVADGRTSP